MTTYYVDYVNGNDSNNGLGPDASHATNKPWKTVNKSLGSAGISSGDTLYLSPAGPFRETPSINMTSATVETKVLGDPQNGQGFKTSGGVRVAPGDVVITGYTTNDATNPSFNNLITLNGRDWLTFEKITFISGGDVIAAFTATSQHLTFRDCTFVGVASTKQFNMTNVFPDPFDLLIERCIFMNAGQYICMAVAANVGASATGADYDVGITVRNCLFMGVGMYEFSPATANTFKPGGGLFIGNIIWNSTTQAAWVKPNASTTVPARFYDNIVYVPGMTGFNASSLGMIVEDYNWITANTARSNVNVGANSKASIIWAPLLNFGEDQRNGRQPRRFLEPLAGFAGRRFGHDSTYTTTEDFSGLPRPTTALRTIGMMERANIGIREISVTQSAGNAICLVGPGTQEFQIPVDAASTVLSAYLRYDSTYSGSPPQLQLLANSEIGVAAQTVAATAAALNAYEKVSLAAITPTAKGIVTVRVISNDTTTTGKTYADTFGVA